ncbi:hypothetical protein I549_0486 [Mycobacterium avium subsp. avium 2285 (R)]|nr:hypothetical protein I549_0486 [Mycobacterium avium subsp. avium 2285 (R)]
MAAQNLVIDGFLALDAGGALRIGSRGRRKDQRDGGEARRQSPSDIAAHGVEHTHAAGWRPRISAGGA